MDGLKILFAALFLVACDDGGDPAVPEAADAAAMDAAVDVDLPDAAMDVQVDRGAPDAGAAWACVAESDDPDYLRLVGCFDDFVLLASPPLDSTLPGARSLKVVIDRFDDNALYFQNTFRYPIHWDFASQNLSGMGLPIVPSLADFNETEYSSPSRRFMLGAVTYYEGPDVFAFEIAPYDSATADMVADAVARIAANAYFGDRLRFHPTSQSVAREAENLPDDVSIVTTEELYAGIDYQPLNVAESVGRLVFVRAADLGEAYLSFRDIAVLDAVPNDISVVSGIITEAFQTPLSHINVLSANRGTPNMALRGAFENPDLRALEGEWVRLNVGALEFGIEAVDQATADAWWEANKPAEVAIPGVDREERRLLDTAEMLDAELSLFDGVKAATRAYGGKTAHYGALSGIPGVPSPPAFGVPVGYYFDFLAQHGLDAQIEAMLADPEFQGDPATRDARLAELRATIEAAPLDDAFLDLLYTKLDADFPGERMRFRSSTNAEDLDGFTGAGLYTSRSGETRDRSIEDAIRTVWASVWFFRAFEERSYRSIDHTQVGMALLVHRSFPDEEANGVALTNNPFDPSGLEPAFYVNVQRGGTSVVLPPAGVSTDAFLYYFDRPDQPITYISNSSLVRPGETVLTTAQTFELGQALDRIRRYFAPAYAPADGSWWAMDVEFKFDGEPGEAPALYIKQARPFR